MMNILQKLKREAAGFLTKDDKANLEIFITDIREYVTRNLDIMQIIKMMYDKRNE